MVMPLRQVGEYGGECPLGCFQVDVPAGGGCYTADPLEACFGNPELGSVSCNYFRAPENGEKFDPAVQCQCPSDITKAESRRLKGEFFELVKQGNAGGSKREFWDYVNQQRG